MENFNFKPLEIAEAVTEPTITFSRCQEYLSAVAGQNLMLKWGSVALVLLVFFYLYYNYDKNKK